MKPLVIHDVKWRFLRVFIIFFHLISLPPPSKSIYNQFPSPLYQNNTNATDIYVFL